MDNILQYLEIISMSAKESDGKIESQESPDKPPGVEELFAGAMEIVLHPWVICDDNIKVRCIAKQSKHYIICFLFLGRSPSSFGQSVIKVQ